VEGEAYAASILVKKMEEGSLDKAPIWSDLKTFDPEPFADIVDCVLAGYPCQPFSQAGKGLGDKDPRHLWPYVHRIIRATRPTIAFFENVRGHVRKGLKEVLQDLSSERFDAEWGIYSAAAEGAPHIRKRLFILAHANNGRLEKFRVSQPGREQGSQGSEPYGLGQIREFDNKENEEKYWEEIKPPICGMDDGPPNRLDRIRALGNAVCPQQAQTAFLDLGGWR
jgi:DNA (cytosine-5)-methyltransferase 1